MYSLSTVCKRNLCYAIDSVIRHNSYGRFSSTPTRLVTITTQQQGCRRFGSSHTNFSATSFASNDQKKDDDDTIPFYGLPGPQVSTESPSFESFAGIGNSRLLLAMDAARTALLDPTRADAVAALGELTGTVALRRMHQTMLAHPVGKQVLKDRPIVSKATLPMLFDTGKNNTLPKDESDVTFGQAYLAYLQEHGFDPDERDEVKYIDDPDLAYIMLRYRQCHDYWHALTGLQPTVLGELALKWLELFQTGFPIACLSSTFGSLALTRQQQQLLFSVYLPWALRVHRKQQQLLIEQGLVGDGSVFLNVYYEKEFDTPVRELRDRLGIEPAPVIQEE